MSGSGRERLVQLLVLVDKENVHLAGVRQRLLGNDCTIDAKRLGDLLGEESGIDRLESFGAKFGRMQDTVVDKLIPVLLREAGEPVFAAIDNLVRLERLGLVASADAWLEMRGLRNRLVHEYIDKPVDLALALARACHFCQVMRDDYLAIRKYAVERLGVAVS